MAVNETSTEKNICLEFKKVPDCLKLTWANAQTPFALPFLRVPNSKFNTLVSPNFNLRELRRSVTSAADKFLRLLHFLASENPIVKKVLSLSSEFQSLCAHVISFSFPVTFVYLTALNYLLSFDLVPFASLTGLYPIYLYSGSMR